MNDGIIVTANEDFGADGQPQVVLAPEDARDVGLRLLRAALDSQAVRITLPRAQAPSRGG